jgi:hypothetical protein
MAFQLVRFSFILEKLCDSPARLPTYKTGLKTQSIYLLAKNNVGFSGQFSNMCYMIFRIVVCINNSLWINQIRYTHADF